MQKIVAMFCFPTSQEECLLTLGRQNSMRARISPGVPISGRNPCSVNCQSQRELRYHPLQLQCAVTCMNDF
jgi:hypothetical protein